MFIVETVQSRILGNSEAEPSVAAAVIGGILFSTWGIAAIFLVGEEGMEETAFMGDLPGPLAVGALVSGAGCLFVGLVAASLMYYPSPLMILGILFAIPASGFLAVVGFYIGAFVSIAPAVVALLPVVCIVKTMRLLSSSKTTS